MVDDSVLGAPNIVGYLVLIAWFPALFTTVGLTKRTQRVVFGAIFGSVMFLPEIINIDPPLIPAFDKTSTTTVALFLGLVFFARTRLAKAWRHKGWDRIFWVLFIGDVITTLTNQDGFNVGPRILEGHTLYDAVSAVLNDATHLYLPYLFGRAYVRSPTDLRNLLRALTTAGLIYTVLALIEMRFSPQLHRLLYGFHQMDFSMTMRWGGYRPMIFMATGMAVGNFLLWAAIASVALQTWRIGRTRTALWLSTMVIAVKSTGAIIYQLALTPILIFSRRWAIIIAMVMGCIILTYPLARSRGWFPTEGLVAAAEKLSPERALSLWFRFWTEDSLLVRAAERPWFGWGGYSRDRIFDRYTGRELSITDGDWIIQFGKGGIVGWASRYLLLTIPLFLLYVRRKQIRSDVDRTLTAALALIVATAALDLVPNGLFNMLPYFFSGALLGLLEGNAWTKPEERRPRSRPTKPAVQH